jgi:septal ring factor EnvC (AmiA/AmiB activator)
MQCQINDLVDARKQDANLVAELKGQVTELEGQATELKGQVTELEGQATELKGQATELKGQVTELEGQVTELKGQVTELKDQVAKLQSSQAQIVGANEALQSACHRDLLQVHVALDHFEQWQTAIQAAVPLPPDDQVPVDQCAQCHRHVHSYKCSGCRSVRYCSSACQKLAWPQHNKTSCASSSD